MTQDNRPQSWRPTAMERSTWTRDAFRAAAGLLAGPGGFILYLAGEYLYDRRHLLFDAGGAPFQAMNPEGEAVAVRDGYPSVNAVPLLGDRGRGTQVLSVTPSLTSSTRAMGLRDGDPVSLALSSRTVSSTRSGLIVPARIGTTTRITVPGDDYAVAALGTSAHALFGTKDPVTGTGTGVVAAGGPRFGELQRTPGGFWVPGARQVNLPLVGRTPYPTRRLSALPAVRCPWCGQTVTGSAFQAMDECPNRPAIGGLARPLTATAVMSVAGRTFAPPVRSQQCPDCGRWAARREDHSLWCRFLSFLDEW
ncbi:hypothetical protein Aph01nite_50140 [Acrocarpospora phusangensis]|uniref:Uncharacterized protein n=1 Tax=Acrocarpospora phusangensis TaxID=1070424 RepID=A0A919UM78_9ACTN|nr:hypothetical protein [Acrocarpospora phusangensis]GIH26704.1 hypothetical protein Aph01nite_50140 [Acrocarpospora phusangensis]